MGQTCHLAKDLVRPHVRISRRRKSIQKPCIDTKAFGPIKTFKQGGSIAVQQGQPDLAPLDVERKLVGARGVVGILLQQRRAIRLQRRPLRMYAANVGEG